MTVENAKKFFDNLELSEEGTKIAEPIEREISARLGFMVDVGLGYLTLDRKTGSLSGGEAQRIRLATQVGSGLVGVCYVLDEPTIGLHQRDNTRLIRTLLRLRDIGNTVIMVEHDEDCIRSADHLIDIGPGAGAHGGQVIVEGAVADLLDESQSGTRKSQTESTTLKYLIGEYAILPPEARRPVDPENTCIEIKGCRENISEMKFKKCTIARARRAGNRRMSRATFHGLTGGPPARRCAPPSRSMNPSSRAEPSPPMSSPAARPGPTTSSSGWRGKRS
jgi:excinuclease ABC subunit A